MCGVYTGHCAAASSSDLPRGIGLQQVTILVTVVDPSSSDLCLCHSSHTDHLTRKVKYSILTIEEPSSHAA